MTDQVLPVLINLLKRRTTPAAWNWFQRAIETVAATPTTSTVLRSYTGASRQLGREPLKLEQTELQELRPHTGLLVFDRWRCDDLGRIILLLTHPSELLVSACYEMGDSSEQESWLRGLSLIPQCERFRDTAIDSCRTNILPLFESIACENPYPLRYFPELNFNQIVLKSLFNGIALSRIIGLESRFNDELSRMADDYVSEREAAGRPVPVDIWLVVAPKIRGEGLDRVRRYLQHENPQHRRWAAEGLRHRKD
jgi:hypothetical protein